MKITKMRNKDGSKLDNNQIALIVSKLSSSLAKVGFITEVAVLNSSSVKVGMHMCSFRIDTNKLGYNARINDITVKTCKLGYKRTSTPTWTQREEFNHIINNVLDHYKVKANIKSGEYIIRTFEYGRVNNWSMPEVIHNGYGLQVPSVLEIVPMKYAENATEWVNINAPFIASVPSIKPRFMPRSK